MSGHHVVVSLLPSELSAERAYTQRLPAPPAGRTWDRNIAPCVDRRVEGSWRCRSSHATLVDEFRLKCAKVVVSS